MSDLKSNIKKGIDSAATMAKDVAGRAVDKGKEAATAAGKKTQEAGKKLTLEAMELFSGRSARLTISCTR